MTGQVKPACVAQAFAFRVSAVFAVVQITA